MKLQPHDWTQLADVKAVRPVHRSDAGLLALPAAALALCAAWLAALPDASTPRLVLAGICAALALLPLALHLRRRVRALAADSTASQRQLRNILGSVREGVFVIDRELRLGASCSASMSELLRFSAPAGRRVQELLQPLLDYETLAAALTFLRLLWSDRADEHAVEALNPLGEVEVAFVNARGTAERRYLSFSFRRVAGTVTAEDCIIGVVDDVTDRVLLARELEQAEAAGDTQAELLLQLVRADPIALLGFLDDADTAFRKSNALLTAPGSEPPQLQKKLIGVMRELDAVTGAAEMLPFASFAQRLQGIDDVLSGLCARSRLTGNDFLPVVVRLDELMSHAATMRFIHQHLVLLRAASAALAARDERAALHPAASAVLELS
jgi:two-component system, chemotaxis family, sensor kinase CheA